MKNEGNRTFVGVPTEVASEGFLALGFNDSSSIPETVFYTGVGDFVYYVSDQITILYTQKTKMHNAFGNRGGKNDI